MTWWPVGIALALLLVPPTPARRIAELVSTGPGRAVGDLRIIRALPAAVGVATMAFLVAGRVSIMIATLIVVFTVAQVLDSLRTNRRARRIETATVAVLAHVSADLKAGALLGPAFTRAADDLPPDAPQALKDRFAAVAAHTLRGGSGAAVLATIPELAGLARIWALSESHGLPSATLLEQARHRLTAQQRHRSATSASLQGPQATAVILAALPLAGIVLGTSMGADPVGFLLGGGLGGVLLVLGVGLICGGILISRAIIGRAGS